jgi:hypothetical protein
MAQRYLSLILVAALLTGCAMHSRTEPGPRADDRAGAVAANVWYVPGRVLVCGMTALLVGVALTVTLGQVYDDASQIMHGGCAGPWTVKPDEIRDAAVDR